MGGPKPGSVGATLHPTGSQEVFTEHCSGHHRAPAHPTPMSFFFLLVLNGKEGRGEEEGVDTKASEKMCKLPVGPQAETDWIS